MKSLLPLLILLVCSGGVATIASADVRHEARFDTLTIAVMSTTDLHGRVLPWDYYEDRPEPRYALSKVATLVDSVRGVHRHHLLLDAGDWFQGNAMAEYFARVDSASLYPLLAAADLMAYDALVLGNHEFNFGIDILNRRIVQTETPILGGNIHHHGTDVPAYVPYLLRDFEGVRVGIIGLTTPGSAVWDRPRVEGRLDFGDGVEAARRFVREVRDRGADIVIVLAHTGLDGNTSYPAEGLGAEHFGRSIAEEVSGIDLLVLGHTHRVLTDRIEGAEGRSIPVIQAGRWADHLAIAELDITRGTEGVSVVASRLSAHRVEHAESKPEIEDLAREGHEAVRAFMATPLARTDAPWPTSGSRFGPSAAISLIHAAQFDATGAQLSAAAAFTTDLTMGPEEITLGQVTQLYPYENALYLVEISGADLKAFLEHSARYFEEMDMDSNTPIINRSWPGFNFDMIDGATYRIDLSRPVGSRIIDLQVAGRAVGDSDVFTMAVNSYRAEGGGGFPGMGEHATVLQRIDRPVRDIIADYLRKREFVTPGDVISRHWKIVGVGD
jgi:2',3'-cyclic-nucleotide 2'-phosphodiesterase (5'-nucleotidase family)